MKAALAKWPNYVKRFGPWAGTRLALAVERRLPQRADTAPRAYTVPGFEHRVWLRDAVSDHAIFWQCLVMQQYAFDHFPHAQRLDATYREALTGGRTPLIIDCGANIGLSCLWFARRFPQARIVAVEPDADNLRMLEHNTAHLGDRIRIVAGAVWPRSEWLRIVNPDSGAAAFRVEVCAKDAPGALRGHSIAELRARGGGAELLVVKIDIEGSQRFLFANDTEWLGDVHLVTLELDDWLMPWAGTSRAFFQSMSRWPFEYLLGGESIFCFRDRDPHETKGFDADTAALEQGGGGSM